MKATGSPAFRHWHPAEIPLLFPTVGMAGGIALAGMWSQWSLWPVFVFPSVIAIAGVALRRPRITLTALAALLGAVAMWLTIPAQVTTPLEGVFRGKVIRADDYGTLQRCVVRTPAEGNILLSVYDYDYRIIEGDSVEFAGVILPSVREVSVPYEKDGRAFALVNSLSGRCVADVGSVRILKEASGMDSWLYGLRERMKALIRDSGVAPPVENFLIAVLLGDNRIDSELRENFRGAGLSHLLALSGTHVAVIAFLIAVLFFPVGIAGSKRMRIWLTLGLLWGYALLTGMSPSVVRAVVMASSVSLSRLGGVRSNPVNALCAAAILICLFKPASLFMPGFQLSFMAVLGILMLMPLRIILNIRRRWLRLLCDAVLLPVAAVVGTAPLAAWHFHSFPVWFLLANLPAAVLLPVIIVSGVALMTLTAAGLHTDILSGFTDWMYDCLADIARLVDSLPGGVDGSLYFPAWLLLPVYGGMFLLWLSWRTQRRSLLADGGLLLLFAAAMFPLASSGGGDREIFVWNTPRSTNILYKSGDTVTVYTDAAEKYFPGLRERASVMLADYLGSRGVRDSVMIMPLDSARREDVSRLLPEPDVLITSKFRGNVLKRAAEVSPRRLVLSPSIPPRRRKAYADTLSRHHIPFLYRLEESR